MIADQQWLTLLAIFNRDLFRHANKTALAAIPPAAQRSEWLGFPGATEAELAAAEVRLGVQLPPSYRTFLALTNGWRGSGPETNQLLSTTTVGWLRDRDPDWLDAVDNTDEIAEHQQRQRHRNDARTELATTLAISARGNHRTTLCLLNPQVIAPDGEWEAWYCTSRVHEPSRYRSFWTLLQARHQAFLRHYRDKQ